MTSGRPPHGLDEPPHRPEEDHVEEQVDEVRVQELVDEEPGHGDLRRHEAPAVEGVPLAQAAPLLDALLEPGAQLPFGHRLAPGVVRGQVVEGGRVAPAFLAQLRLVPRQEPQRPVGDPLEPRLLGRRPRGVEAGGPEEREDAQRHERHRRPRQPRQLGVGAERDEQDQRRPLTAS